MGIVDDILKQAKKLNAKKGNSGRTKEELDRIQSVNEIKSASKKKTSSGKKTSSKKEEPQKKAATQTRNIDKVKEKYEGGKNAAPSSEKKLTLPSVRKYNPLTKAPVEIRKTDEYKGNSGRTEEELDRLRSVNEIAKTTPEDWLKVNMEGVAQRNRKAGVGAFADRQTDTENFSFARESSEQNMADNADALIRNWDRVTDKVSAADYLIRAYGINDDTRDIVMGAFENASTKEKYALLETANYVEGESDEVKAMRQMIDSSPDRVSALEEKINDDTHHEWTDKDGKVHTSRNPQFDQNATQDAAYRAYVNEARTYEDQQKLIDKYIEDGHYTSGDAWKYSAASGVSSWWTRLYDAGAMAFTEWLKQGQNEELVGNPKNRFDRWNSAEGLGQLAAMVGSDLLYDLFTAAGLPVALLSKIALTPEDVSMIEDKLLGVTEPLQEEINRQQRILDSADISAVEKTGMDIMRTVIEMVPGIAMSVVSPSAGLATFGVGAGGASARQAYDQGASLEDAVKFGLASGAAETLTERMFTGFGQFGKGILSGIGEKTGQKLITDTTRKMLEESGFMNSMSARILKKVVASGGEATEEMVMEVVTPYLQRTIYDPNAADATLKEIGYAGGLGAAVAAILGIPVMISEGSKAANVKKGYDEIVEDSRKELWGMIDDAVASGEITEADAAAIRAEAEDIAAGKGSLNVPTSQREEKLTGKSLDTVYDSREEALEAMKAEARTKADGTEIKANYIEDGDVKTFTTTAKSGALGLGRTTYAAPQYQKIAKAKNITERSGYQLGVKEDIIKEVSALSKAIGKEIKFVWDENRAKHGAVQESTGKIFVNVNSSQSPARAVIAHEMTHLMEGTSAYAKLYDLVKESYGSSWKSKLAEIKSNYGAEGENLEGKKNGYDEAETELMAMFVEEKLLTDADVVREIVQTDKTVAQKIIDWFNKVIQKLVGTKEQKVFAEARDLWNKALQEEKSGLVKERTEEFIAEDAGAEVRQSIGKNDNLMKNAIKRNKITKAVSEDVLEVAKAARKTIKEKYQKLFIADNMSAKKKSPLVGNDSYSGSLDNTTICTRSLTMESIVELVAKKIGRPLRNEESIIVAQELMNYTGDQAECLYCYQANAKRGFEDALANFADQRRTVIENHRNGMDEDTNYKLMMDYNFEKGTWGKKPTDTAKERFDTFIKIAENKIPMAGALYFANTRVLNENIEDPKVPKAIKDQLKQAKKYAQGAVKAHGRVYYAVYNGQILRVKEEKIKEWNNTYGLRMYSFSDFSPAFILENMQMITDASVLGLKMLAYTKEAEFVEIFGGTGMAINISVAGVSDGQGGYHSDGMQGMNWETAKALRDKYPAVGTVYVAKDDAEVEWAMEQEWIDTVIPFHISYGSGMMQRNMGWKNYSGQQSEKKKPGWDGEKGDKKTIYPSGHHNDRETYLRLCEENNLTPKFSQFLKDKNGNYNPNYMKLVNETRQKPEDIKPVQPVFNMEAAEATLERFAKNGGYNPILGGTQENREYIADEITEKVKTRAPELKARDGMRYSISRPLTESDLQDYLRAGKRRNKNKQEALDRGEKIILTTDKEIRDYIDEAIHGNVNLPTVAYAKVSRRLSDAVKSDNKNFDIEDYYIELVSAHLLHAYRDHKKAKRKGDIDLDDSDFLEIPNLIENFDEVLDAVKFHSGKSEVVLSSAVGNDKVIIVETVSASRNSLQFRNMWGVTESKYNTEYKNSSVANSGGNQQGSNTSPRFTNTTVGLSITNNSMKSNTQNPVNSSDDYIYMEAVNRGDMTTAQRMVDEAAEIAFANSKIRDEDGKLVVVYHGTESDFTVFDRTKSRANMDIQGNFFSPWEEDAAGYGRNVRKFYLNITNPASESIGYKTLRKFQGQNNAGVKAAEELERLGYDGVNNGDEEYIAFNSNQIKSADPVTYDDEGNIIPPSERFNPQNKDIRWSVGSSNNLMRNVIKEENRKMREVFHRRNKDDRETLWSMIEDEQAYIARTGGYRRNVVQDIIDFAYESGYRKGNNETEAVNSWGRQSIYVPEDYRGEMETLGGLAEVNRELFGSGISFTYKKKGGSLDDAYSGLLEENRGILPDTTDPGEQVQAIIDVFGTGKNFERLKDLDDEAWEEFGQDDRPFYADIERVVYDAMEELSAIARVNMVDTAREADQKTIKEMEKIVKKAENQRDFTKQEKADLKAQQKEKENKYKAELDRRRKEADAELKAQKKNLAAIAKEYEKGNTEKARSLVEEEQKRIDAMYRKTDKELRKERADAIVKEYFKQKKQNDPNSTESTWLKSKSVKNIVDQFRRETIAQLVYAGRFTVTNDNVIIDENQQEVAVRKDDTWDFSEVKNTYTPYFGMTLLAKQEGIDVDRFFTMFAKIRDMQTRPKDDFKTRSRKEEVVAYINSLNLTKKQKEFLYYDAARYAKSTMPTFLDGGKLTEEKGNIRGRMMEALDNISFDMFNGHMKEDSRWAKADSAQIRQEDINNFVEMLFGEEDSEARDAFLSRFTLMIVDYSEQMEEARLVRTSNLLINKPQQSDPLKMRVVRAYREAKQNFLCEGEAFERMADKMKNPLIKARYYQAKSAVAIANEMINGKHQRNLDGDLMGKSLYQIFEPIFKADRKAKNSNGIELLTELVNNRHDIYRQKEGKGYTGNTIEECEAIVENISTAHPEILKVADELVEYGRNLLRMCVDCGRISQEDFEYFVAKYPYYVPAYRVEDNEVMDRSGKVRRDTAVIKTAKFGNRDVLPLWDQMVRRTNEMVKACKKNQLAYELVKATRIKGHEDFVSSVMKTIDQGNTENAMATLGQIEDIGKARRTQEDDTFIPWYCNGEKFDVDIADASLLYGWDRINYRMDEKQYHRVLRKMNGFRRAVLTQYNPTFWLTNHIRDVSDMFLYNQHAQNLTGYMIEAYGEMFGGKIGGTKAFQKAYKKATGKEYVYDEEKRADALERYLSKGASQASIFEYDNTNAGRKDTKGKVKSVAKKPLEAFDAWNFMFEQVPRLAVFNETIDRLTKEREKGKNEYTDEEIDTIAAYQAADATLNFGRSGTVVKNLNTYGCTFLNAGVQGMDRARRMFTQIKDGDKKTVTLNLCGLVFKIFAMGYSVHIILDWIYGGDDEYANAIRELLYGDDEEKIMQEWKEMSDYNKMNYLIININGAWIRIPQGRLSAFLYSFGYNGEKVFDGEMDALDLVEAQWDMAKETVLFGNPLTNNILGPVIEAWRNKDNWGNDIVSEYEDMGEGFHYLEYDDETSMAARKAAEFGHWLTADLFGVEGSRILDFSPKKLDHVMKQYFGSYANLLTPFLDGGTELKDKVSEGLAETLFKKFYIDPVESNRLAGDYYDLKEKFENTAKAHDNDSPYAVAVRVFDDYNELLKPLREQITAISDDPNLTAEEKAEQILVLREEMNQIYRDAVADAKDALGYAHANYYGKDGNSDLYDDWQRLTKGSDWVVSTMSDTAQAQFAEVSKTGVDAENFVSAYDFVKNATADKDENGKSINGSKKEKIVNYLNSLDLTADQKMSLYTNVAGYKVSDRAPAPSFVSGALIQPSTTNMASPLSGGGDLTSGYGWRTCPFHGKEFHQAVDIAAESGTDVGAVISGTVTMATVNGGYGNSIEITSTDENGNTVVTKYNHLLNMGVEVGDVVNQGTKIGEVGSTGSSTEPHLDFRLKINNDWVDPTQYIDLEASGIVNSAGYTQKEGSGGTASGGGSSGSKSGGGSRSGGSSSGGSGSSRVASVSSSRSGGGSSGLTLPTAGSSSKPTGRSTNTPTYGAMGLTLPRVPQRQTSIAYNKKGTSTQRTGRTGGSFWDDSFLS